MKSLVSLTILAAALFSGAPALAQRLGPGSGDGPVDITADELEVQNKQCVSIWRGKAEALQGDTRLRADVLKAFFESKGSATANAAPGTSSCGDLLRLEAEGSVYYVTPQQRLRGDAGTYDAQRETVVVTGDVIAVQGQNVVRGTKMTFNTRTGEGHMVGSASGRNQPNRPRGVFYPKKSTTQDGATPEQPAT
jgi:lipopolysaccharide export system protein LptA